MTPMTRMTRMTPRTSHAITRFIVSFHTPHCLLSHGTTHCLYSTPLQARAEQEEERLQHLFLDSVAHHRMLQVRLRPVDPFLGEE